MPIEARRIVRKCCGGAQAHLLLADDGYHYVVKFRNTPQHRRTLVNEWIGNAILQQLGILCPVNDAVYVSTAFLKENPGLCLRIGTRDVPVETGWHYGSRFPGDPATTPVFDIVPDNVLLRVENRTHFLGTLFFDRWTGNTDTRQCVFARVRAGQFLPDKHPLTKVYIAFMIDQGNIFNGSHWEYIDAELPTMYPQRSAYSGVRISDRDFWFERFEAVSYDTIDAALERMPAEWLDGDMRLLRALVDKLLARRRRVQDWWLKIIEGIAQSQDHEAFCG